MKKFIALSLAVAMLFAFAACGGDPETTTVPETTVDSTPAGATTAEDTTAELTTIEDTTAELTTIEDTTAELTTVEDTSAPTTAAPATNGSTTTAPATTAAPAKIPSTKAEIVKLYNDATAKIASSKPGFTKVVKTELKDLEMGALAKLDIVRTTVGDFLNEGTVTTTVKKGEKNSENIIKSSLKESDVASASCKLSSDGKSYELTITLKNEKNPLKSSSALGRVSADFKDKQEITDGINEVASVQDVQVTSSDCTIKATISVDDTKASSITHTIAQSFSLTKVKYTIITISGGTGKTNTVATFKSFAW